jgi:hypothetical protein
MDELITLNQLKQYDAEKTNKLNVRFDSVANDFNNCYNYIDNTINNIDTNVTNLYDYVNNVHNELNETYNNFNTLNLSASNATIDNLNVANVVVDSLDVNHLNANDVTIMDLNVTNVVANNVTTDEITFNSGNGNNLFINGNYVLNNALINDLNDKQLVFWNNGKFESVSKPASNGLFLAGHTNGNFTWMSGGGSSGGGAVEISEADFNAMGYNADNGYKSDVFYVTQPNGNMYYDNHKYVAWSEPYNYVEMNLKLISGNHFNAPIIGLNLSSSSLTSSSTFDVKWDAWSETMIGKIPGRANVSIATWSGTWGGVITDYPVIYFNGLSFQGSPNMTDCFLVNDQLITNKPAGYNVWNGISSVDSMFERCTNFNQPVTIPNSVTSMIGTFAGCSNFNQPVTIPNSVTSMTETFADCIGFNQPVTIGNSVTNMVSTFGGCSNFNQPVTIPNSVTNMINTFAGCNNFNQLVTIGDSVTNMARAFTGCTNFNQPVTIPNSVTSMAGTFGQCHSFNQPVTIPNSVTSMIGTFAGCNKLGAVTIGNSVTNMMYAFEGCTSLKVLNSIPDTVTDLRGTFTNCPYIGSYPQIPIHISHTIALGDTTNYIYNMLVNGGCGKSMLPTAIRNDA